jgi:hypothetical protein
MTGPTALSLSETAALIGSLKHRSLRYEDEPVDVAKEWRSKLGVPTWEVDTWVGSYEAIAAGEFEATDPASGQFLEDQRVAFTRTSPVALISNNPILLVFKYE